MYYVTGMRICGGRGARWHAFRDIHTCIHAYMHAHKHTYIHAGMHAYMYTYMHTCIHAYIHTCIHACIHAYIHIGEGSRPSSPYSPYINLRYSSYSRYSRYSRCLQQPAQLTIYIYIYIEREREREREREILDEKGIQYSYLDMTEMPHKTMTYLRIYCNNFPIVLLNTNNSFSNFGETLTHFNHTFWIIFICYIYIIITIIILLLLCMIILESKNKNKVEKKRFRGVPPKYS